VGATDHDAMSLVGRGPLLASGVQGGTAHPVQAHDTPVVVLTILAMACVAALIFLYMRRRARRPEPVTDQWKALAVMGELCPHGWEAHVKLYGWGAPVPADAPAWRVPLIELEWKQYAEETGQVAVARRVWAPTIGDALQSMVDDRRTDVTLEEIERAAADDDVSWND
jgi:hypothetical protein